MFTEVFFISLTWAVVVLVLILFISFLIYRFTIQDNLECIIRTHLDEAERYVKYLRSVENEKQED